MAGGSGSGGMIGNIGGQGSNAPQVGMQMNPYQQIAPLTNQQIAGMRATSDVSGPTQQALQNAQQQNAALAGGSLYNPQQQQYLAGGAGFNPGTQGFMTSGALMNANANPYLQGQYQAAAKAMTDQYQQATAPNLLQQAAQSGTLGSAGMAQGFENAQSTLGANLGDLASNMYGNAYNQGLQATLGAQQMGLGGMETALGQGLQAMTGALDRAPSLATGQFIPAQQQMGAGQVGQQQAQNVLNAANQNLTGQAQWPMQALQSLGQGLNTAAGGGGQSVSIGSSPAGGGK